MESILPLAGFQSPEPEVVSRITFSGCFRRSRYALTSACIFPDSHVLMRMIAFQSASLTPPNAVTSITRIYTGCCCARSIISATSCFLNALPCVAIKTLLDKSARLTSNDSTTPCEKNMRYATAALRAIPIRHPTARRLILSIFIKELLSHSFGRAMKKSYKKSVMSERYSVVTEHRSLKSGQEIFTIFALTNF